MTDGGRSLTTRIYRFNETKTTKDRNMNKQTNFVEKRVYNFICLIMLLVNC